MAWAIALMVAAAFPATAAAAPPANDTRDGATELNPPATVEGTTAEATLDPQEATTIAGNDVSGTVWYRFNTGRDRRVVVRVLAAGDLDAAVEIIRRARSQYIVLESRATDEDGRAVFYLDVRAGTQYLIRVGQRTNSVAGTFRLQLLMPQLPPPPPGRALPRAGTTGSVDPLDNSADAWSQILQAGVTYRIRLTNLSKRRLALRLFAPGADSFIDTNPLRNSGGYILYTPPAGESGRYSLLVVSSGDHGAQRYRLRVGIAQPDDMWPGTVLRNYRPVRGSFSSDGVDVVDTYRFDVVDLSSVSLRLRTSDANGYELRLLSAGGRRLVRTGRVSGTGELKQTLEKGRYVVVVRGHGTAAGRYVLRRAARAVTRLRLETPAQPLAPGSAATLRLQLTPGASGAAKVWIERYDPLTGWHFDRMLRTRISAGSGAVTFRPPTIGKWRARATYEGSRTAEASSTRGVSQFLVQAPLEP